MNQGSWQRALGYGLAVTFTVYAVASALLWADVELTLTTRLLSATVMLALLCIIAKLFYGDIPGARLGFEGFLHAMALLTPLYAVSVTAIAYLDSEWFYDAVKPGFAGEWSWALAPYALVYWAINGALVAIFYISIPYELLDGGQRLRGILGATAVFSLNYNLPLLGGGLRVDDILFFGLAFAYSYSVSRSPGALMLAYLVAEAPLWWCLLAPLGSGALALYAIARLIAGLAAAYILLRRKRYRMLSSLGS